MRGLYLLLFLALVVNVTALGQNIGDYRSGTSGPWNQTSTWEVLDTDGVTWIPAGAPPSSASQHIYIQDFTVVDVTATITVDELTINSDAVLNIQSGVTFTIANGAGDDLFVTPGDGFFTNDGFFNVLTGSTVINQGYISSALTNMIVDGTFRHAQNGGVVPNATWNTGSLIEITAITNTRPIGFQGQSFYDFRWNCTTQSATIDLLGHLTSVQHNLDIVASGAGATTSVSLTSIYNTQFVSGTPLGTVFYSFDPLVIGNDLTVSGTGALALAPNTGGVGYSVTVGGNFTLGANVGKTTQFIMAGAGNTAAPGSFVAGSQVGMQVNGNFIKNNANNVMMSNSVGFNTSVSATINVNGSFTWNAGTLTMANGTQPSNFVTGQLNLGGDLTIAAGSFQETSSSASGAGIIIFDDSHVHNFTSPVSNPFNTASIISFTIPSSNTLNIGPLTSLSGLGSFTLNAGATLGVASPDGISAGTTTGNVRTPGNIRTYIAGANVVYNGTSAQILGNEWEFNAGGKLSNVAVNLEINNAAGVTNNVSPIANVVGDLRLTNGAFDIGTGNSLSVQAAFTSTAGTITGHNNSNLSFINAGTVTGNLNFTPGFQLLNNLTIGRSASIFLGTDLTISTTGTLTFSDAGNLRINGNTLTIDGNISQTGSGAIASNNVASNLIIGGSGPLGALPLCTGCGFTNEFNNVTLSRSSGGTYTWNSAANINGTIALNSGALTISSGLIMATGSTFQRSAGTTVTGAAPTATTTYNVSYIGTINPTGVELPTAASNALANLTVAGNVTLDKNIRILGNVSITSGTLDAGAHNVNMAGPSFAVNGGSFTIAPTNTITFSRAGTTALTGSTIGGSTFGNLTINSGATVSAPNANINITGTWTNNGAFTPNNGTVTFNGSGQNINTNGQPFWNVIADIGTKTLTSNLNVDATLTITAGTTLDGSGFTIFIGDDWDNQGTYTFDATSLVAFDGTTQAIDGNGKPFGNVAFNNTGTKTLASAIDVNGSLTIASGVTFDTSPSNFGVALEGNWTNNGTFAQNTSTVTFDGSVTQTVGGTTNTTFHNMTQTNPSTLTISSAQSLANALTISNGVFNPNGNFTMLSTATRDARINQLGVGASISATNMTIQRYLPNNASARAVRYLASPVTNAVAAGWKDDFPITGPFADHSTQAEWPGLPAFNATGFSINIYNEAHVPTSTIDDRYEGFPTAAQTLATQPLVNGRGYAALVRQTTVLNIELVGRAAFGPVPVTVTSQAGGANDGYNLVGNPYPSPINWNNVTLPGGVSTTVSLKDNTNTIGLGAGQYVYYTQGGPGIPASYTGNIAQGQAFWVRKLTAGPATLTFQEDDKQPVSAPPMMRDSEENILRINVVGNGHMDEAVIAFRSNGSDKVEADKDATKFENDFVNLASLSSDNFPLAINTMGSLECSRQIPITLNNVEPGNHFFTFSQLSSFASGVDIRLHDSFTGTTVPVNEQNNVYSFEVTTDTKSFGNERFKAFIGYKDIELGMNVQTQPVCTGNDAQVTIMAPQLGVTYYASLNGTTISDEVVATSGSQVTVSIPKANLTSSSNTIILMAKNKGCTALPLSNKAIVEVKNMPVAPKVTGSSGCGEGSFTLVADGAPAGGSYRWYLTEDSTDPIDGQINSSFTTPSIAKTKTYFVSAVNSLGCEGARMAVTATVTYQDETTISVNGNTLVSNSATGNQWYLNDVAISGATKQTYDAKESGVYTLVVTQGACSNSVAREFAVTGDIDKEVSRAYVLYPNPSPGLIYVEVATTSNVAVSITNTIGSEITRGELKQEGDKRKGQFDISGHANGVYLVIIKHDNQTVIKKIVKN